MQVNVNSMMAHQDWMTNNANNVANVNSDNFKSTQTTIQNPSGGDVQAVGATADSGTNLAKEMTEQIPIEKAHGVNVQAIKSHDEMIGTLLDMSV